MNQDRYDTIHKMTDAEWDAERARVLAEMHDAMLAGDHETRRDLKAYFYDLDHFDLLTSMGHGPSA